MRNSERYWPEYLEANLNRKRDSHRLSFVLRGFESILTRCLDCLLIQRQSCFVIFLVRKVIGAGLCDVYIANVAIGFDNEGHSSGGGGQLSFAGAFRIFWFDLVDELWRGNTITDVVDTRGVGIGTRLRERWWWSHQRWRWKFFPLRRQRERVRLNQGEER